MMQIQTKCHMAPDKVLCSTEQYYFSYFFTKTYIVDIHKKQLNNVLLTKVFKITMYIFCAEIIRKIFLDMVNVLKFLTFYSIFFCLNFVFYAVVS